MASSGAPYRCVVHSIGHGRIIHHGFPFGGCVEECGVAWIEEVVGADHEWGVLAAVVDMKMLDVVVGGVFLAQGVHAHCHQHGKRA